MVLCWLLVAISILVLSQGLAPCVASRLPSACCSRRAPRHSRCEACPWHVTVRIVVLSLQLFPFLEHSRWMAQWVRDRRRFPD